MKAESELVIDAVGLSVAYPNGVQAVDGVNFQARAGEFIALLGSNGSGKTTLIKALVRLLKPSRGTIRIFDKELDVWPAKELYQRVGVVFQNPDDQLFASTVEEDAAFGPRNLGLTQAQTLERVEQALLSVGALSLRGRQVHELSFGEKKRVAVAGALAMRPAILILDEPTAGLDPAGERRMLELLGRLNREEGLTIVMATHYVDLLPLFARRLCVLNRGRILKTGSPADIFGDGRLLSDADLRLPHVAGLMEEFKRCDGAPIEGLPLTTVEARRELRRLLPALEGAHDER